MEPKSVEVLGTSGVTGFRAQIRSWQYAWPNSRGPRYIVWHEPNTMYSWQCPWSSMLWVPLFVLFSRFADSPSLASLQSNKSAVVAPLPHLLPSTKTRKERRTSFSQKPQEKSGHDSLALTGSQAQL